jgi:hypothetical protein
MVRSILSVVVGYAVLAILVTLSFAPIFMAPEFAFRPGTCEASTAFTIFSLVTSFIAAIVGGLVAAVVARKGARFPVRVLASLILAFGLISAIAGQFAEKPVVSSEEVARMTPMQRAEKGQEPTSYAFLLPFIGCGGVLLGGTIRNRKGQPSPNG